MNKYAQSIDQLFVKSVKNKTVSVIEALAKSINHAFWCQNEWSTYLVLIVFHIIEFS